MLRWVLEIINYKMQIRRRLAHVYQWYLILIGSLFTGITFFKTRPNGAAALAQQQTNEGYKSRESLVAMQISSIQWWRDCRRKKERHKQTKSQRQSVAGQRLHSQTPCEAAALFDTTWLRLVRLNWAVLSIVATIACGTLHNDLHLSNLTAARNLTAAHALHRATGPVHADHVRQPRSNHWSAMWSCDV